jgi:hypothetical protein
MYTHLCLREAHIFTYASPVLARVEAFAAQGVGYQITGVLVVSRSQRTDMIVLYEAVAPQETERSA